MFEKIIAIYPELKSSDFSTNGGTISLRDDGHGVYIEKWEHSLPRPTQEQLDAVIGAK